LDVDHFLGEAEFLAAGTIERERALRRIDHIPGVIADERRNV
jgi:hypothetical protein